MKVLGISPRNFIKTTMIAAPLLCAASNLSAKESLLNDKFEKTGKIVNLESHISIEDMSPCLGLADGKVYPALIVDLDDKKLYQYKLNTFLDVIHPMKNIKRASKKLKGLNVVKHVFKNKEGYNMIVMKELDVRTGKPTEGCVNLITDDKEHFVKNKYSIILETKIIDNITKDLESGQYIWIK